MALRAKPGTLFDQGNWGTGQLELRYLKKQNKTKKHLSGLGSASPTISETGKANAPATCHLPDPISRDRD